MSNVESDPAEQAVSSGPPASFRDPPELLQPREVPLGGPRAMLVRRSLPNRDRRMIGAWCFVDAYGPTDITGRAGMQVPPHPHIGLQTVSWLVEGEVWHQDSLGTAQLVLPGALDLMTAGRGIAHSEQSPSARSPRLHGVQLWVALPDEHREVAPHFEQHPNLPVLTDRAGSVTVIIGELARAASPARAYSPLVGAEVALEGGQLRLPLEPAFEHGLLALSEPVSVDGRRLGNGSMLYLGPGRKEVVVAADRSARALLLGGVPFEEQLVMWWNFVARTHDEIVRARTAWESERTSASSDRFGLVTGYDGPALPAPRLPNAPLRARPRHRQRPDRPTP